MRLQEHLTRIAAGDIAPRVVEHEGSRYVAWTPTWEGPARPDWAAAHADLVDRLGVMPSPGPDLVCWEHQANRESIRLSFSIKVF